MPEKLLQVAKPECLESRSERMKNRKCLLRIQIGREVLKTSKASPCSCGRT